MRYLERMGHAAFQYPTPDGYPVEAEPWLGTLLWRWNFAMGLERNRFKGTRFDADRLAARIGSPALVSAHLLGRRPTDLERDVLAESESPLALLLAGPAFQWH